MRNLPCPDREQVRDHLIKGLAQYVRKGVTYGYPVTEAQLDAIVGLYDLYDAAGGAVTADVAGDDLPAALRQAVHDSYRFTHRGLKLAGIRSDLLNGVEYCPVCGISPPRELDHYLPRGAYKPLAIYIRNLVPHCHDCNHIKSDHVADEDAERFVHAYFDLLPNTPFLAANVALHGGALEVEYAIVSAVGLPADLQERLTYQLQHLSLNERYRREINSYLTGHTVALHMAFDAGQGAAVAAYLARQASVEVTKFHLNHWRPCLLRALAAHHAFCAGGFADVFPLPADLARVPADA